MHDFEFGDVVRVPFPYTDRNTRQRRPAFVTSDGRIGEGRSLLWVLMITSAENRPWVGDVTFGDSYAASGLPAPSVVRTTKIATIEASHAERIGKVPEELASAVTQELKAILKF